MSSVNYLNKSLKITINVWFFLVINFSRMIFMYISYILAKSCLSLDDLIMKDILLMIGRINLASVQRKIRFARNMPKLKMKYVFKCCQCVIIFNKILIFYFILMKHDILLILELIKAYNYSTVFRMGFFIRTLRTNGNFIITIWELHNTFKLQFILIRIG